MFRRLNRTPYPHCRSAHHNSRLPRRLAIPCSRAPSASAALPAAVTEGQEPPAHLRRDRRPLSSGSTSYIRLPVLRLPISCRGRPAPDPQRRPTYIATVPRLGYRLVAPVSALSDPAPDSESDSLSNQANPATLSALSTFHPRRNVLLPARHRRRALPCPPQRIPPQQRRQHESRSTAHHFRAAAEINRCPTVSRLDSRNERRRVCRRDDRRTH